MVVIPQNKCENKTLRQVILLPNNCQQQLLARNIPLESPFSLLLDPLQLTIQLDTGASKIGRTDTRAVGNKGLPGQNAAATVNPPR
jgi:hypothetical protein